MTDDEYFSKDMLKKYLSVSTLKKFIPTPYDPIVCEESALAEINGEIIRPKSTALLVGSYVDVALTGTPEEFEDFKKNHPEIISSRGATKGELKADFKIADKMIETVKKQPYMMRMLEGEHQGIYTGEIFGVPFKIKIDSLGDNFIADLKTTENISKAYFDPISRSKVSFAFYFDYILQGAIYQEIVYQNTGKKLPFFLVVVSKESVPDVGVYHIDDNTLRERLFGNAELGIPSMEDSIRNAWLLLQGKAEPCKCGHCDYCKERKVITKPLSVFEIGGELN